MGGEIRYSINSMKIHMHPGCLFNSLFKITTKKIKTLCITCPLWRELPVTVEPSQSVVNEQSICTPWRQRQSILPCIKHCHRDCNRRLSLRQLFITSVVLVAQGVFIMVAHCEAQWQICVCEMVLFKGLASVHCQATNLNNDELSPIRHSWTEFCNCFKIKKIHELCLNKRLSKQSRHRWFKRHRAHYDVTEVGQMGVAYVDILYKIPFQICRMSVMVSPITGHLSVC